jgi:lipopolysaccharide transport system ATP-binding protein
MTWAVRFENVSKRYHAATWGYASLRDDLTRFGHSVASALRGRKVAPRGPLALDHVSFEVQDGEPFAVVGPNGAGKTTALKILSRISFPTEGRVRVRGRVGALIEVGSGVHPELTGRENIWLYGRIMGMSRREIARRFDQIVEFAELGHVLDVPVKRYSSGMQLRLGFSIASHLDPEVFVVDEALAVGDAGFQARCVERMMGLVAQGRALLFVSHNLSAVETLCSRGAFLLDGRVQLIGDVRDVVRSYLDWVETRQHERSRQAASEISSSGLTIERVAFYDAQGRERDAFRTGEDVEIRLRVWAETPIRRPSFEIGISDGRPGNLILCSMLVDGRMPESLAGASTVSCRIRRLPLLPRVYQTWCSVRCDRGYGDLVDWQVVGAFRVTEGPPGLDGRGAISHLGMDAPVHAEHEWRW